MRRVYELGSCPNSTAGARVSWRVVGETAGRFPAFGIREPTLY